MDLSPDQKLAFDRCLDFATSGGRPRPGEPESVEVFTCGGLAGSGKTTVLGHIAKALQDAGKLVAYATFTGRASGRLQQSLARAGVVASNRQAVQSRRGGEENQMALGFGELRMPFCGTLHRLLYAAIIDQTTDECLGYRKRTKADREYDLIVIDECFHYAQRVLTEDGWDQIGKIVNEKRECRVWCRNKSTGELELKPVVRWLRRKAPQELLEIDVGRTASMRNARLLKCTPGHKIMTPTGYVRAGDLRVGDELIVRGRHMTQAQFSTLVGSMLGDGSMGRHATRNSPQPRLTQGEAQLEWLKFKMALFGDLSGPLQRGSSGYGDKRVWHCSLKVTDQARRIAEQMPYVGRHPGGRRRWSFTDKFLEWVDELALTVWFLDNGRQPVRGTSALHTERFSKDDNDRLAAFLSRRFGLDSVVRSNGKGHHFIWLGVTATARLMGLIAPYVPACMAWKAPTGGHYSPEPETAGEVTVAPITRIGTASTKRSPFVYDIEVADNHNYIAGNVLVSNCSMVGDNMLADIKRLGIKILAVGDHGQLPPVGDKGSLMENPDIRLEKIHRQAEGNPIIQLAHTMRNTGRIDRTLVGDHIRFGRRADIGRIYLDALKELQAEGIANASLEVGALCFTNRTRIEINRAVRKALQYSQAPKDGEVVMCVKNTTFGVFNGMRGIVVGDSQPINGWQVGAHLRFPQEEIETNSILCGYQFHREKTIGTVEEMQRQLPGLKSLGQLGLLCDFGYSATVHKFQGSQLRHAIWVVDRNYNTDDSDWRRFAYTAITRASERLTILF